ncbi:fungal-specific transcription factor domain-containing protein [Phyllosticta citrichinensis]|uniref:Fungal-specific transcription factor domain-containing protein n=1 Tax=Phyllosticta citrichinensis TaxID=1130410 RepID=A0ABR1XUR4_9PEZI
MSQQMPLKRQPSTPPPRNRTRKACDRCYKKKSKCDGKHPCLECINRRTADCCTYGRLWPRDSASPGSDSDAEGRIQCLKDENTLLKDRIEKLKIYNEEKLVALAHRLGTGVRADVPPPETLIAMYFSNVHPQFPMIHRARFEIARESLYDWEKPPLCLQFAMVALTATTDPNHAHISKDYYDLARTYFEEDKAREETCPQSIDTVSHVQARVLIATFEYRYGLPRRASFSLSAALHHCKLMRLHREDGAGVFAKSCAAPPKDFADAEERRRTFWVCFNLDVYMSTEDGTPRQIREEDVSQFAVFGTVTEYLKINVQLPMYYEGFEAGPKAAPMSLEDALSSSGSLSNLTPFAAACVTACLLGRIASHDEKSRRGNDSLGEFHERHKALENLLERLTSTLADILEVSRQSVDPRHVFVGVCLHTSRIALYRVAIRKTEILRRSGIDENFCKSQYVHAAGQISQMFFGLEMTNMSWVDQVQDAIKPYRLTRN